MRLNTATAEHLIDSAVFAARSAPETFQALIDRLPAAIYLTDNEGTITYFNRACVELAGRTPEAGHDKWCVTWKLFTTEGKFLPHDECPMAIALREKRSVREVEAIAERPDGTRISFTPFPTPYYDDEGNLAGAVNLLMEVTGDEAASYLREQAGKCRTLARALTDGAAAESLALMAAKYDQKALGLSRTQSTKRRR